MINPTLPTLIEDTITEMNAKSLSKFYISTKLNLPVGIVENILKENIKEDFTSLFEGG